EQPGPDAGQSMEVELRAAMPAGLPSRPALLTIAQLHERVQVHEVAGAQQAVGEHGQERRADRDGETHVEPITFERFQEVEEWQVRLGDRLEEPALLERRI